MKFKIIIFMILIFILTFHLFFILNANEATLHFYFFKYPESILIPSKIDFGHFEVIGEIEYGYSGDWIGGCSRDKECFIHRDHDIYAKLSCLDQNDNELYSAIYPEMIPYLSGYIDSDENFVFREDKIYSEEFPILSFAYSEQKELKELILLKKITKINIELKKVIVNWDYTCESVSWKTGEVKNSIKSIKLEGKYEFQIDKQYIINVKYAEK
jgi:hypothetical protein